MTVPAQPTSSSASAPAPAPAVTIAKDTVTTGTSVTGLAGVLAEADAADVADNIAAAISSHGQTLTDKGIRRIRVIGDLSVLGDISTLGILSSQVARFTDEITAYVGSAPPVQALAQAEAAPTPGGGLERFGVAQFLGIGSAVNALGALAGTISQLVTGTYTYSGQAIPNTSIGGLDILVARALSAKITTIPVCVDRFGLPASSQILEDFQDLVTKAAHELNPALVRAAAAAAAAAQIVADDKDHLAKLDAQEYEKIAARLPGESNEAAAAEHHLAEGHALAAAITAFVAGAMSTPAKGGPALITQAAHGERLNEDGTAILYAKVIAAGDDQVLRQTLIHNTWSNLTGLTAEYAVLVRGQEAVAFGLESAFAVAHGSIRRGLTDITRKKVTLRAE
jgi:hypothetical protein